MKKTNYPYMPDGKNFEYVSLDHKFMKEAFLFSHKNSTDRYQPTGAVLVTNNEIIGYGANTSLVKNEWFLNKHQNGLCARKIFKVPTGKFYGLCPGCVGFKNHAEQSAIRDAQKRGFKTSGTEMYLWGHWWCCKPCWDKIIEAEIEKVFLLENSEVFFNIKNNKNILGRQFSHFKNFLE